VAHHPKGRARPPRVVAGDRGVHSADTRTRSRWQASHESRSRPPARFSQNVRRSNERAFSGEDSAGARTPVGVWRASRSHGMDGIERWLGLG
jgi:hypothetical protein